MKVKNSPLACPIENTLRMLVGKWKTIILWYLCSGKKRYGELKRSIPHVSEKMLIQSLRELEKDTLVTRHARKIIPPHVEYALTKKGRGLAPILHSLDTWGRKHL